MTGETNGETQRFVLDRSWRRFADTVLAGSPLRIFRLRPAGVDLAERLETSATMPDGPLRRRWLRAGAIHPVPAHDASIDDVTIVTPVYRRAGSSERHSAIEHRAGQARVVVDDGSDPPLTAADVRLPDNRGPGAARNAGRRRVTTPLVAFVDDDVDTDLLAPGGAWLHPLLGHFRDPTVGLVAPRVVGEIGSPLDLGPDAGRIAPGTRISYVPAAAIVVRTAAFDEIGGFDESLRFGEDVDLVWRMVDAGWTARYEPSSVVWHPPRTTRRAAMSQRYHYGTSAAALDVRHPGALAPMSTNGWTLAVWALVGAGHPFVAVTLAAGSAAALVRALPDLPARVSFGLAMRGHANAGLQIADATRRSWLPIALAASTCSRRIRWMTALALLVAPRRAALDAAYCAGLWRGMERHRTFGPIVPAVRRWPPRTDRGRYGRSP